MSIESKAIIKVYDILGKEAATLLNEEKEAGKHQINFDASKYGLAGGVYFVRMIIGEKAETLKIIYLK